MLARSGRNWTETAGSTPRWAHRHNPEKRNNTCSDIDRWRERRRLSLHRPDTFIICVNQRAEAGQKGSLLLAVPGDLHPALASGNHTQQQLIEWIKHLGPPARDLKPFKRPEKIDNRVERLGRLRLRQFAYHADNPPCTSRGRRPIQHSTIVAHKLTRLSLIEREHGFPFILNCAMVENRRQSGS